MDASALASTLDNLEKSWSSLDWWLNFWTILVVAGVALELVVLIIEYRHDWRDFRRGVIHSPERPSILMFGLGFLGAGLVAIGVAGEFRVHIEAGKTESDMRDATRRLVALANGEAVKANERAEHESLERAKLERELGPRTFSQEQIERLVAKLRPFAGMSVWVMAYGNETPDEKDESIEFAKSIWSALRRAGIRSEVAWSSLAWPIQGVWLAYGSTNTTKAPGLFSALLKAMNDEGLEIAPFALGDADLPKDVLLGLSETHSEGVALQPIDIRIIVGKKPPTILKKKN
ncbi:MAG: hypothetical protein ABSC23_14310 [Bryobacteraceae bacterium]|jgi:hypothetical protein